MISLSDGKQADIIVTLNTTSRYLDDILNINNVYFEYMESQINPSELQLNNANTSEFRAAFLDFLDGDVPRSTSYGVYISQLNRFARASSYITDFNTHN